jgi:hypothetical protein
MPRPNFLLLGAQKAASTSMAIQLARHPDVFLAPGKELNFFWPDAEYARGLAYYEAQFALWGGQKAVGEATPYLHALAAAPRVAQALPGARLLVVLREPVARTWSAYRMQVAKGSERPDTPPLDVLGPRSPYVLASHYDDQFARWGAYFARDRFLVLLAEDLVQAPQASWDLVCKHLGIRRQELPDGAFPRANESRTLTRPWVGAAIKAVKDLRDRLRATPLRALVDHPALDRRARRWRARLARSVARPATASEREVPSQVREALAPLFREGILRLEERLGRDLSSWRT